MRLPPYSVVLVIALAAGTSAAAETQPSPGDHKGDYVRAVTRGAGLMSWQRPGISETESAFREQIEQRKSRMLAARVAVTHPVMVTPDGIDRARRNIASADWAKRWADSTRELADYLVAQPADHVERMIPALTPGNTYGFTCPNCVGEKSQECAGRSLVKWDYRNPDVCTCNRCGQEYPSDKYPETLSLVCPRSGQIFTYHANDRERATPDDRSGDLAWHWVGRPIHVSFTGQIRASKVAFMFEAAQTLGLQYVFSGDPRYALRAKEILLRLAVCYRNWLYHDYWDTIADCDPMHAAWHDTKLALEWKRHLCEQAFAKDRDASAAMLQGYWGAGRVHPSTDGISHLVSAATAYDLVHDAQAEDGRAIWTQAERDRVERDLLLEYVMGAEPFVGGAGKAESVNNKTPTVYLAMAAVGRTLGLADYVDVALRGYEGVRDESFVDDGFSRESPAYTNMYLNSLVQIPETLHGFTWPAGFERRQGTVDLFATDVRLRLMFRAMRDQLRPDGRYPPLSDTGQAARPATHLVEMGLRRYPEYYRGTMPALKGAPGDYALFQLTPDEMDLDTGLPLPELYFPAWMTAFLRHGEGPAAAMAVLAFNPEGSHRHADNLALFYADGRDTVLGDQGYLCDMPQNAWIKSTLSHNLVIVDNAEQRSKGRHPRLERMFTSPSVSMVEAASDCYPGCSEYARLVALVKGPAGRTFLVDIFRVKGGRKHDYRIFSELGSSDVGTSDVGASNADSDAGSVGIGPGHAAEGALAFTGLAMPPEPPLPDVKGSLARPDIFGLRDTRAVSPAPAGWQSTWKQRSRSYRLWMLAPADRVEASNGPGQETLEQPGRRVRYVDVIREGEDLASTFVAVHEPSDGKRQARVRKAERLSLPAEAGPDAVAIRIESDWGTYLLLNRFAREAQVAGVRFCGEFALVHEQDGRFAMVAHEAARFDDGRTKFATDTPVWTGRPSRCAEDLIVPESRRPPDWSPWSAEVKQYVVVRSGERQTGYPVRGVDEQGIHLERFPLAATETFRLSNLIVIER